MHHISSPDKGAAPAICPFGIRAKIIRGGNRFHGHRRRMPSSNPLAIPRGAQWPTN